jgi:hypothetical protein
LNVDDVVAALARTAPPTAAPAMAAPATSLVLSFLVSRLEVDLTGRDPIVLGRGENGARGT